MKAIHSNLSLPCPSSSNRKYRELSHGARVLKSIQEELRRVRELLSHAESDELRQREKELVEAEKLYKVYEKRFRSFTRVVHKK